MLETLTKENEELKRRVTMLESFVPKWTRILSADDLPKRNGWYFIVDDEGERQYVFFDGDRFESGGGYRVYATHWMEQPPLPTDDTEQVNTMIEIKKNPNGDTRTAPKGITFEEFAKANDSHIGDVRNVMNSLSAMVAVAGKLHDNTKKIYEQQFYKDFVATMNEGANFVDGWWYQKHVHEERHHPLSYCHDDINLIDILETIVDCTVAGLARSGDVRPIEINSEILNKAVANTTELIKKMVTVTE